MTETNLATCPDCVEGKLDIGCAINRPLLTVDCPRCQGKGVLSAPTTTIVLHCLECAEQLPKDMRCPHGEPWKSTKGEQMKNEALNSIWQAVDAIANTPTTGVHTATPWKTGDGGDGKNGIWNNCRRVAVCSLGNCLSDNEPEANAAFIVRAVNSHDKLVAALRDTLKHSTHAETCPAWHYLTRFRDDEDVLVECDCYRRAALRAAEGGE